MTGGLTLNIALMNTTKDTIEDIQRRVIGMDNSRVVESAPVPNVTISDIQEMNKSRTETRLALNIVQYIEQLEKITSGCKNNFNGAKCFAKVVSVYDGDTLTLIFKPDGRNDWIEASCRMLRYNSAEVRTKDLREKAAGLAAKKRLTELVGGNIVYAEFGASDKYGRPLVELYSGMDDARVNYNDVMIKGGFGREYNGAGEKLWE